MYDILNIGRVCIKMKIVISIIICLILIIYIIIFIFWNNRAISRITLDINPSIEINLDKKDKIKSVIALNDDAKEIINGSLKGKSIDDVLNSITDNLIEKEYVTNDLVDIILYSEGNISNKENGFICEGEYARLKGKTYIIYEAVEAKS